MRRARQLVLVATLVLIAGCQRRAPGPWECEEHALRVVKRVGPLTMPQVEHAYRGEIARCLTTPYDRDLIRCVEERGPSRSCYQDFERRLRIEPERELPNG